MNNEFEGKTEMEAIDLAVAELGLARDEFDVEILESMSGSLFKKGKVRIRVHLHDAGRNDVSASSRAESNDVRQKERRDERSHDAPLDQATLGDIEEKVIEFTKTMIEKMGYSCSVSILFREDRKLGLRLESESASILIGKKGKNLDALQLLANVYVGKMGHEDLRIVIDSENYRIRREESLVRLAYEMAEKVRLSKQSVLLEPMNPFERRIIHTTLNDIVDVETKSEGEGLYKQVRVFCKGSLRV